MILALTVCLVLCGVSSTVAFVSIKKNLEFMERIDEIEGAIQNAIDVLDIHREKIDQKSKIEVFSDEPVVKELVQDIASVRNAVLDVAKLLDDTLKTEDTDNEETQTP